jgi:hypothetical protein
MHWRASVLTREPILDVPTTGARGSDVPIGPAAILVRVAAASYIGTLVALVTGILVLGTVRHGATAFAGPSEPAYLAAGQTLK